MEKDKLINFLIERKDYHSKMVLLIKKHLDIRFQHLAIRNELYSIIEYLKQQNEV